MTELRKSYSEQEMNAVAKQAMEQALNNQLPGQSAANGGVTRIPLNKVVPIVIQPKTPEQIRAEEALARMAQGR